MLLAAETLLIQNCLETFKYKGPEIWINIALWVKAIQRA